MSLAESYLAAFAKRPAGAEPGWLGQRRRRAIDSFAKRGLPSRRDEAWRFTDLSALAERAFPPALGGATTVDIGTLVARHALAGTVRLVLLNGRFAPDLSDALPAGVTSLAAHPDELAFEEFGTGITALNAAFAGDGLVLRLGAGVALERPIHLIHVTDAAETASFHTRHLIALGDGASARLIETHLAIGAAQHWTNSVTTVRLEHAARLEHVKLLLGSDSLIHHAEESVEILDHAAYDAFFLTVGGHRSRQDVSARLGANRADCAIGGVTLLRGTEEATLATTILHDCPHGTTREVFKCVLDDSAHAVFLGCIKVAPDAQKTNANQLAQTLLLSDGAHIDAKPELEILADDVKCSHGATVGALDPDQLFYLVSRGIPQEEARAILIGAFAASALESVRDPVLRSHLEAHVTAWLGARS